jgi:hypothetical protein
MDKAAAVDQADAERGPWWAFAPWVFLAGFLTFSASLMNLLDHHGYPLFRTEIFASFVFLAMLCGVLTAIYMIAKPLIRRLMEALLLTLLIDLSFTGFTASMAILIASFAVLKVYGRSIARILTTFGAIVLLTTFAGALSRNEWPVTLIDERSPISGAMAAASDRPAIVHIILDEHLGFGGFPDTPAGRQTRDHLVEFYTGRGFRIFPRAYSEHLHTINAVPSILNFGEGEAASASKEGMVLGPTRIFRQLDRLGYRVTVYQSSFGDYCAATEIIHCVEYETGGAVPLMDVPLPWDDRTRLILANFFKLSDVVDAVKAVYLRIFRFGLENGYRLVEPPLVRYRSSTFATLQMFDIVTERIEDIRPGEAVFFHALFPHYPLATRDDCSVKPYQDWRLRRDWTPIEERQEAYYEQLRCTARLVDDVIAALERSPASTDYVLVLHGDHGSRITRRDPRAHNASFLDEDLTASFSTMVAIRISGREGGIDNSLVPVSAVVRDFSLKEYKAFPATISVTSPSVMLDDRDWRPVREMEIPEGLFDSIHASEVVYNSGAYNE